MWSKHGTSAVPSTVSAATSRKDVDEVSFSLQGLTTHRALRQQVFRSISSEFRVHKQPPRSSEKPARVKLTNNFCELDGEKLQHNYVHDGWTEHYEDRQKHPLVCEKEVGREECKGNYTAATGQKLQEDGGRSETSGPLLTFCTKEKKSRLGLCNVRQLPLVESAKIQSSKEGPQEGSEEARKYCAMQLQQAREHAAWETPQTLPQLQCAKSVLNLRRTPVDRRLVEKKLWRAAESSPAHLPELRQFTLELLYALSVLRPLGGKRHIRVSCLNTCGAHTTPTVDKQKDFCKLRGALFTFRPEHFNEDYDEERERELCTPHDTRYCEAETSSCQQPAAVAEAGTRVCHICRRSYVEDIPAVESRFTDAVLLCEEEDLFCDISSVRVYREHGSSKDRCFESNVSGLHQQSLSGKDEAAVTALAAVASDVAQLEQSSFASLAEKIITLETAKEVAAYLCGCFGPLLHLLQTHMRQTRSQLPGSVARNAGTHCKAASTHNPGDVEVIGLQEHHQLLQRTDMDETVKGVNAILQVLMEADESAVDATLNIVCNRLFSLSHDKGQACALSVSRPPAQMAQDNERVGQARNGRTIWQPEEQQRKGEHTPTERSLACKAESPFFVNSGPIVGEHRNRIPEKDMSKERTGRQLCSREDKTMDLRGEVSQILTAPAPPFATVEERDAASRRTQKHLDMQGDFQQITKMETELHTSQRGATHASGLRQSTKDIVLDCAASLSADNGRHDRDKSFSPDASVRQAVQIPCEASTRTRHISAPEPQRVSAVQISSAQKPQGGEEHASSYDRSPVRSEPLSSHMAWLAEQLSTPLDALAGESTGHTDIEKKDEVSKHILHILDAFDAGIIQPSESLPAVSSDSTTTATELVEGDRASHAWETNVQLVLPMLREQEQQAPVVDSVTNLEGPKTSVPERSPKRRAIHSEASAEPAAHRKTCLGEMRLHSFAHWSTQDEEQLHMYTEAKTDSHARRSFQAARVTGGGAVSRPRTSSSSTRECGFSAAAEPGGVSRRIAAAAAVERAAAAAAQQGVTAARKHATVGNTELMASICDIGETLPAESDRPSLPATGLAASSCRALRRAVEFVESYRNCKVEDQSAELDSEDIFAELDDKGLDNLVTQLLNLAGRPVEHRREDKEQLVELGIMQQTAQHKSKQESGYVLREPFLSPISQCQQLKVCQPSPQQHQQHLNQSKHTNGENRFAVSRDSAESTIYSTTCTFSDGERTYTRTNPVLPETLRTSARTGTLGNFHWAAMPHDMRGPLLHKDDKSLPADVSPALVSRTGALNVPPGPLSRLSAWHSSRPSISSGSSRLSLPAGGISDNDFSSAADSPPKFTSKSHLHDTPRLPAAASFGPARRHSNVKRSPWRSCEPYSSSASTAAASPAGVYAHSFGSSSLTSSPFSLQPTPSTVTLQATEVLVASGVNSVEEAYVSSRTDNQPRGEETRPIESVLGDEVTGPLKKSYVNRNPGGRSESSQRRLSVGGTFHPFGLLPARVSVADSSAFSACISGSRSFFEEKGDVCGSAARARGGIDKEAAESLYAQLRALECSNICASTRTHDLPRQEVSSSAPIIRALSALAPPSPPMKEATDPSISKSQRDTLGVVRTQASTACNKALEALSTCKARGTSGSVSSQGSIRSPFLELSSGRLVVSNTSSWHHSLHPTTSPPPQTAFDSGKSAALEEFKFDFETQSLRTGDQQESPEVPSEPTVKARGRSCVAGVEGKDTSIRPSKVQEYREEHQLGDAASVRLSKTCTRDTTGGSDRMRQQQSLSEGNWLNKSGPANRKALFSSSYVADLQHDAREYRWDWETAPSSAAFTRCAVSGVRREAATAGCIGAGGTDCLCGGTLCLYRSPVSGVVYDKSGQKWTARWNEDGRQHKRTFAAAKYGFLTAKEKAEACRGEARERTARARREVLQQQQQQQQQESFAQRLKPSFAAPTVDGANEVSLRTRLNTKNNAAAQGL